MSYKEGQPLRIIADTCAHGLNIGEEVYVSDVDSNGNVIRVQNIRGSYRRDVENEDFEEIKEVNYGI